MRKQAVAYLLLLFAIPTLRAQAQGDAQDPAMAKWMELASPGAAHKELDAFIGKWSVEGEYWMAPGTPPGKSTAEVENSWVLGGRFVQENYKSEMMGQAFTGLGYFGYDNQKQQYVNVWMDTMATGVLYSFGAWDAAKKELTFSGEYDDPMAPGQKKKFRNVMRVEAPDRYVFEMYETGADGKEFKNVSAIHTKKP